MRRSPAAVQVFEVRIRSGEMDGLDRFPERYEPPPSHDLGWQGVNSAVGVLVYQSLHDGADPVAKHHPRLGLPTVIDRHDAAHVDQVVMAPGLSLTLQDLEGRIFHLQLRPTPAPRLHQSVEHQLLADSEGLC